MRYNMNPIKGDGTKKIEIDMGELNCLGEPYVINLGKNKFILRYKLPSDDNAYGKITLEATAHE